MYTYLSACCSSICTYYYLYVCISVWSYTDLWCCMVAWWILLDMIGGCLHLFAVFAVGLLVWACRVRTLQQKHCQNERVPGTCSFPTVTPNSKSIELIGTLRINRNEILPLFQSNIIQHAFATAPPSGPRARKHVTWGIKFKALMLILQKQQYNVVYSGADWIAG